MSYGTCDYCRADIVWAFTETGKRIPLDPAEYPREDIAANVAWHRDVQGRIRARVLRADRPLLGYEHRAMPHAATCRVLARHRAQRKVFRDAQAAAAARQRHPSVVDGGEAAGPGTDELQLPMPGDELAARRTVRARQRLAGPR